MSKSFLASGVLASAMLVAFAAPASAATTIIPQSALVASTDYYTNSLGAVSVTTGGGNASNVGDVSGRNDDGFRAVSLGFNVTLYGTTYNSLYINNNGNVSFTGGLSQYVPSGTTGANVPVISPWFGDVDTRGALSGVVHYQLDTPGQLVVTWDNVGSYSARDEALNSFQLVLRGDDFVTPAGEGKIGFFYKNMGWESTATSTVAAVGFGDGSGNGTVLEGSTQSGLNPVVANHHIWFDQNLTPIPGGVPEPSTWAMMILGFGVVGSAMRRRKPKATVSFA